jgi:hypothetical protein
MALWRAQGQLYLSRRELGYENIECVHLVEDMANGRLLWIRWWTFGFLKRQEISWLAERLLASQEALGFMKLVNWKVVQVTCEKVYLQTPQAASGNSPAIFIHSNLTLIKISFSVWITYTSVLIEICFLNSPPFTTHVYWLSLFQSQFTCSIISIRDVVVSMYLWSVVWLVLCLVNNFFASMVSVPVWLVCKLRKVRLKGETTCQIKVSDSILSSKCLYKTSRTLLAVLIVLQFLRNAFGQWNCQNHTQANEQKGRQQEATGGTWLLQTSKHSCRCIYCSKCNSNASGL